MAEPLDVVVVGLNVVDVLVRLPAEVRAGEKHEVRELVIQGGAPAGNAACGLARLGWRVGFVARLGDNTLSAVARADLARHGVRDDLFIADPAAQPAAAVVQIDPRTGDRTVFYSLTGYRRLAASDAPIEAARRARLVLVDGYEMDAVLPTLRAARDAGVETLLDIEAGEREAMRRLLELGTHCILPLGAAQELTGERAEEPVLRRLAEWTPGQVVVTDGVRGSWAWTAGGVLHQPAFAVEAVDTTGCGDAFHAAYGSALLDGLDLPQRLEFAALFASRVAMATGGRTNLPTREDLRRDLPCELSPTLLRRLQQPAA